MPLINHSIPNLINGVSQQSESLRLGSQAESQVNGHASVVEGLKKRTPTEFVKKYLAQLLLTLLFIQLIEIVTRDILLSLQQMTLKFTE